MFEIILEFLLLFIFRYPGAFILSLFSKRKTFHDYLQADGYLVGVIGLVVVVGAIQFVIYALSLWG